MTFKNKLVTCLVCICALSLTVVGAFASYKTMATGESTAKVAVFAFSASGASVSEIPKADIVSEGEIQLGTLTVSNKETNYDKVKKENVDSVCEVTQKYTITLKSENALPSAVAPELRIGDKTYYGTANTDRSSFEFSHPDFTLPAGEETFVGYSVYVTWLAAPAVEPVDIKFTATVLSEQVD